MSKLFNIVPTPKEKYSTHDNSHSFLTTFNIGGLYPIMTELVTPGEKWKVNIASFIRTMPLVSPVLGQMDLKIDAFAVPIRLIWDDFEKYISEGPTGGFSAEVPALHVPSGFQDNGGFYKLTDHFGFGNKTQFFNALPFRAYQKIYNDYYRNQNYQEEIPIDMSSGTKQLHLGSTMDETNVQNFYMRYRNWNRDYFTSILPEPQKGPAVKIPFEADIESDGVLTVQDASGRISAVKSKKYTSNHLTVNDAFADNSQVTYSGGLKVSDGATPPTIETLRFAETLQEYCEAMARGGTRYAEYLRTIWNVKSRDSRLQRAEYLGGYRGPISISEVMQQAPAEDSPLGTLAGKGISAGSSRFFKHYFDEWTVCMVIMSVVPRSMYGQGCRRWLMYEDPTEWPNPFFGNLGEQEIFRGELYSSDSDVQDREVLGYMPRQIEAKYIPSTFHGQFKNSLSYWHVGRQFEEAPYINKNFIQVNPAEEAKLFPDISNVYDNFIGQFMFQVKRKNHLPYYGVPRFTHIV